MTSEMELVVGVDGVSRCIYDEALDLREIGKFQITRASHVEPDRDGFWWADMGPSGGPVLGPYASDGSTEGGEGVACSEDAVSASGQWLADAVPDASAFDAAFNARRCKKGLVYRCPWT